MRNSQITAVRYFVPSSSLTNADLSDSYQDWSVEKIYAKTGIESRQIAGASECASDLAVSAARELLEQSGVHASGIDYLILCTQSPDYYLPTTACVVHEQLGLPVSAGAIDVNQGCSGFVYGLSLAKGLIESGQSNRVLLVTADTYSKYIHPEDRSVRTLFGDGAAATLVESCVDDPNGPAINGFVFGTDGSGANNLIVPAGGNRHPLTPAAEIAQLDEKGNKRAPKNLYMNGPEIFQFSMQRVPQLVDAVLERSGLSREQVDWFVLHQANSFMLEALRRKIKVPKDKFPITMATVGNTVSSTIPIALRKMDAEGQLKSGDRLLLAGFGVGYSWSGCVIKWL